MNQKNFNILNFSKCTSEWSLKSEKFGVKLFKVYVVIFE